MPRGPRDKGILLMTGIPVILLVALIIVMKTHDVSTHSTATARQVERPQEGKCIAIVPEEAYSYTELRVNRSDPVSTYASLHGTLYPPAPEHISFVWSVNGKDVGRGNKLDPEHFHRGDRVEVRLQGPGDSGQERVLDRASTVVLNSTPVVRSVVLRRSPGDSQRLEAVVDVFDADDEPLVLSYGWTLGGRPVRSSASSSISLANIPRGSELIVTVAASDGWETSLPGVSPPFRVENQPPDLEVREAQLLTDTGEESTGTWAALQVRSSDPDGDPVSVELIDPPADVQWEPATRRIVWRVEDGSQTINVRVRATDGRGGTAEREIQLSR